MSTIGNSHAFTQFLAERQWCWPTRRKRHTPRGLDGREVDQSGGPGINIPMDSHVLSTLTVTVDNMQKQLNNY